MTRKQYAILARQDKLTKLIPNAISCEYMIFVNGTLSDGFIVKTVNINYKRHAYYITAYRGNEFKIIIPNGAITIDNVNVHYIISDNNTNN